MLVDETRAMNDRERRHLAALAARGSPVTTRDTMRWVMGCAAVLGAEVAAAWLLGVGLGANAVFASLVVLGPVALLASYVLAMTVRAHFHWRRADAVFARDQLPRLQRALALGRVAIRRVEAAAVVEIEEAEDEGAGFIFDIGAGRFLLVKGQRYGRAEDDAPWPSATFEIVRALVSDERTNDTVWLGIFSSGDRLEPSRLIPNRSLSEAGLWEEREEIITGTIDDVLSRIQTQRGAADST